MRRLLNLTDSEKAETEEKAATPMEHDTSDMLVQVHVVQVMTTARPWRDGMSVEKAGDDDDEAPGRREPT